MNRLFAVIVLASGLIGSSCLWASDAGGLTDIVTDIVNPENGNGNANGNNQGNGGSNDPSEIPGGNDIEESVVPDQPEPEPEPQPEPEPDPFPGMGEGIGGGNNPNAGGPGRDEPIGGPLDSFIPPGLQSPRIEAPTLSDPIDTSIRPSEPSFPSAPPVTTQPSVLPSTAEPTTPEDPGALPSAPSSVDAGLSQQPTSSEPFFSSDFSQGRGGSSSSSPSSIQRYSAGGSSIVFQPADEVAADKKIWGMGQEVLRPETRSSTQFMFTGTVVSIDRFRNTVVVRNRHDTKTLYVGPSNLSQLRKGSVIQATLRPGNERVESIRQIVGGGA